MDNLDNITVEQAKRLLRAIFNKPEPETDCGELGDPNDPDENDNYPETRSEKVEYSEYVCTKLIEYLSRAVRRLSRLDRLLLVASKSGDGTLPDIITNNELRMALEPLMCVKNDIDEITQMLLPIYRETKTADENRRG